MPYIWLSRFAQADDHAVATDFVESLSPEEYLYAVYEVDILPRLKSGDSYR